MKTKTLSCICKHCKEPFEVTRELKHSGAAGGALPEYCDKLACQGAHQKQLTFIRKRWQVEKYKKLREGKIPKADKTTLMNTNWSYHHDGTCEACHRTGKVNRFNRCVWCYKRVNSKELSDPDDIFYGAGLGNISDMAYIPTCGPIWKSQKRVS